MLIFNEDHSLNVGRTLDQIEEACEARWGARGWVALPPVFRNGERAKRLLTLLDLHASMGVTYGPTGTEVKPLPGWAGELLDAIGLRMKRETER